MTPAAAVKLLSAGRLVLPGIQRSFVWSPRQIAALFDSMMRGYPIGGMLLWSTRRSDNPKLTFRKLVADYRGKETEPPSAAIAPTAPIYAVLDGQQRLTALRIALQGSYATARSSPVRRLHIDLDSFDEDAGAEAHQYRFEFQASPDQTEGCAWFCVSDTVGLRTDAASLNAALEARGLKSTPERRRLLKTLATVINGQRIVEFRVEDGDLDRALNVFARINLGGTQLTYVDLLVSTLTSRWPQASDEITSLRRGMNAASPEQFAFTADRIVKAGLVILDPSQPKFHVDSFMRGTKLAQLEAAWPRFRQSLIVASRLLADFGLSGRTLPAQNVVIPIAFYAYHRQLNENYVHVDAHERDRAKIRAFVARTLVRRNFWTGATDQVLVAVCKTIAKALSGKGPSTFPLASIEEALKSVKSILFDSDDIEDLVSIRFGDRRTAPLLRLLYPHMITDGLWEGSVDKDHIFPFSRFSPFAQKPPGVAAGDWHQMRDRADRLVNLQLLRSADNQGKGAKLPKVWLAGLSTARRSRYGRQHVKYLPDTLAGATSFWDAREENLRKDVKALLRA